MSCSAVVVKDKLTTLDRSGVFQWTVNIVQLFIREIIEGYDFKLWVHKIQRRERDLGAHIRSERQEIDREQLKMEDNRFPTFSPSTAV